MKFLHYPLDLGANNAVEITLDKQANVRLLDENNFYHYKRMERHSYYGGLAKVRPVVLKPPHPGKWHLVIDLGGYEGHVTASVRII